MFAPSTVERYANVVSGKILIFNLNVRGTIDFQNVEKFTLCAIRSKTIIIRLIAFKVQNFIASYFQLQRNTIQVYFHRLILIQN